MNKEYETPEFKMIHFEVKNKIMAYDPYEDLGDYGENPFFPGDPESGDEVSASAFILNV